MELYIKEGNEGTFAFSSETGGEFKFCFQDNILEGRGKQFQRPNYIMWFKPDTRLKGYRIPFGFSRKASFDVRVGIEAKDYSSMEGREKMTEIDIRVTIVADNIGAILRDLYFMKEREAATRVTNGW